MNRSNINETPVKARFIEVDLLKGVAIILVILGHVLQYSLTEPYDNHLFNFIYSFHMPLFVFISGFLSYKVASSLTDIKKRAYQLLPPFLLWPAIRGFIFNGKISFDDYALLFKDPSLGLWFLWILFLISSFFTLVGVITKKVGGAKYTEMTKQIVLLASVLFAYLFTTIVFRGRYGLWLFSLYIIFFYGGWVFRNNYLKFASFIRTYWWFFFICFMLLTLFWSFNHHPTFISSPNKMISNLYNYLTGFMGSIALFSICSMMVSQSWNLRSFYIKPFISCGKKTLGLYAIHLSIIVIPVSEYVNTLSLPSVPTVLLSFVITLIATFIVYYILNSSAITRLLIGKIVIR